MSDALPSGRSSSEPTSAALSPAELRTVRHALGPEERLVDWLRGVDVRGPAMWVATTRRLLLFSRESVELPVIDLAWSSIACVELRSDPFGTLLRVRATGRQAVIGAVEPLAGNRFAALLRQHAGLGDPLPMPAPRFLATPPGRPQVAHA